MAASGCAGRRGGVTDAASHARSQGGLCVRTIRGYDRHVTTPAPRDPVADLERIAFLLERRLEPSYRVKAFRGAARTVRALPDGEAQQRATTGRLTDLPGVGPVTAAVIAESLTGELPAYLAKLEEESSQPLTVGGEDLRAALKGDSHVHSNCFYAGGAACHDRHKLSSVGARLQTCQPQRILPCSVSEPRGRVPVGQHAEYVGVCRTYVRSQRD